MNVAGRDEWAVSSVNVRSELGFRSVRAHRQTYVFSHSAGRMQRVQDDMRYNTNDETATKFGRSLENGSDSVD